jgi:hypothetical protein
MPKKSIVEIHQIFPTKYLFPQSRWYNLGFPLPKSTLPNPKVYQKDALLAKLCTKAEWQKVKPKNNQFVSE